MVVTRSSFADISIPERLPVAASSGARGGPRRQGRVDRRSQRPHASRTRNWAAWRAGWPPGWPPAGSGPATSSRSSRRTCRSSRPAFHGVAAAGGANTTINSLASVEDIVTQLQRHARAVPTDGRAVPGPAMPRPRGRGRRGLRHRRGGGGDPPFARARSAIRRRPALARPRRDRRGDADVRGHDWVPEGGAAHAPQPRGERRPVQAAIQHQGARRGDRRPAVLPHLRADGADELALRRGATVVTMPRSIWTSSCGSCRTTGVTLAFLVPPIVAGAGEAPRRRRVRPVGAAARHLRRGAAGRGSSATAAAARLGCTVLQGYGMTETQPGHARRSRGPRRARPARRPADPAEHRVRGRGAGDGRRGSGRRARTARSGSRPAGHEGLPRRPRRRRHGSRRRRLAAHRRHRPRRRRRLPLRRGPAEGADQVPRASRWRRPSWRRCCCSTPAWPMPP